MALMIVALELCKKNRLVLVERVIDGSCDWLVARLPLQDDTDRFKLEYDMEGTMMFKVYEEAEKTYEYLKSC